MRGKTMGDGRQGAEMMMRGNGGAVAARRSLFGAALAAVLFLGGLALRCYRIGEAPSDFHPDRQYHAALVARALHLRSLDSAPAWKRDVAAANLREEYRAEPPIMEHLAAWVYGLVGREVFWAPRLVAVMAWMLGGVFLWALARRMLPEEGRLAAVAVYWYVPFGVTASRSLQPEALVMLGLMAGALCIVRHFERPSRMRFLISAVVAGLAVLVKPGAAQFIVWSVFAAYAIRPGRWARGLLSTLLFAVLSLLPTLVFFLYGLARGSDLAGVGASHFVPRLLLTSYLWKGWVGMLLQVCGLAILIAGGVGTLTCSSAESRRIVWSLAFGYVAQRFLTPFATASHDYWHLPVIPVLALGFGRLCVPIWDALIKRRSVWLKGIVLVLLAGGLVLGVERAPWIHEDEPSGEFERMALEIGDAVDHSTQTVLLDYCFGKPTFYFGWFAGTWWPESAALRIFGDLYGARQDLSAEERFQRDYAPDNPEYFIVSRNLGELQLQPDLAKFLEKYPVKVRNSRYVIWDLRRKEAPATRE